MIYMPTEESNVLVGFVKEYAKGRVLDMGTGSGILAKAASSRADEVIAVDILQEALDYVSNLKLPKVTVFKSDLFTNISGTFDLIVFNPPFAVRQDYDEITDEYLKSSIYGGKYSCDVLERFLLQVRHYLNTSSLCLIMFGSMSNKDRIENKIKEGGLTFDVIYQKKFISGIIEWVYLLKRDID